MARHTFGGGTSDWAFTFNGDGTVSQSAGAVLTFWDSLTGGSQYTAAPLPGGVDDGTGLLDSTGVPVSSVTCDSNGEIPDAIQGPDDTYRMAADGSGNGTGPRRWITANDMGDDLNALFSDVAAIPALEAAPVYVYYDPATAAYPARPDVAGAVWWVGPVAPDVGGTGATASDVWLNTTGATPPGGVTSVTAGDTSITVGGTASAPTIETGTLDVTATLHPPAGPVPMNGQRFTGLANGLAATDSAAFGQIPAIATAAPQPLSTATAGATGTGSDAGHVHDWAFIPTGVKTAGYTATGHDFTRWNTSAGPLSMTLPNGPADRTLAGAKITTGGNPLTINCSGTDVFQAGGGATSLVLRNTFETVILQYVTANKVWLVLTHDYGFTTPATSAVFKPADPSGTSSTAGVMMGLGGTATFTPQGSGTVLVTLTTLMQITAGAAGGVTAGARYGTGTAPANGAAVTGTVLGPAADPVVRVNTVAAGVGTPHTVTDRLALTPGVSYWFDLKVASPAGTDTCLAGSTVVVIHELVSP